MTLGLATHQSVINVHKIKTVPYTNLQREDHHCEAHKCCDAHCHNHRVSVMEAGNHSHHVGHAKSQDGLRTRKNGAQFHGVNQKSFCRQNRNGLITF